VPSSIKQRVESLHFSAAPSAQSLQGLGFVMAMWLLSRFVIIITMQVISPYYPATSVVHPLPEPLDFISGFVPQPGWELFAHWDAAWFKQIATMGYSYVDDGKMHNIAFFPVLPIAIRALLTLGIPVNIAGVLINNFAFLGALILLYRWAEEYHGVSAARWSTAVLAWCPFSLFGTVIYSEGLFLLLTTASLRAFEKGQYLRAALWGALTTATRVTGAALLPAFLLVAWRERRPPIAYIAGLATGLGVLCFMIFCAIRFNDPLAFFHAQKAWTIQGGVNWQGWWNMIVTVFTWQHSAIRDLTKLVMFIGGGYLLWHFRSQLSRVAVIYGFCSLGLIFFSGAMWSINRYVFGIVSMSLALGLLLSRHQRWGYATMGLFGILLVGFTIRFSWWRWIA
jgi:Gpi18-like mannosyltransferase